jgi:23S rRNA (cytosine1962-C5)-methyltransferase
MIVNLLFLFNPVRKHLWFYDHRENRKRIASYVKDKKVLDVFSYLGAFAIPIAKAGAEQITCIDSSATALAYLEKNAKHNQVDDRITLCQGDAFILLKDLKQNGQRFDVIVLDPPALIKRKKEYNAGLHAYEQLNQLALELLNPNGILLSASCSMHLSEKDLQNVIRRAVNNSKRHAVILEHCHQAPDHPIHPAIEETNYLKGFIVMTT